MKKRLLILGLVLAAHLFAQEYAPAGWTYSYLAAKQQAFAEKKDLLLCFSGSDWSSWSVKLNENVFFKREFVEAAKKDFILVMIDSPRSPALATSLRLWNNGLVDKYRIEGLPTVVLLNHTGKEYARTGYLEGGPAEYLKHLADLKKENLKFRTALEVIDRFEDAERSKAIDSLVSPWPLEQKTQPKTLALFEEMFKYDPSMKDKHPYFAQVLPLQEKFERERFEMSRNYLGKVLELKNNRRSTEADIDTLRVEFQREDAKLMSSTLETLNSVMSNTKIRGEELQAAKLFAFELAHPCPSPNQLQAAYAEIQAIDPKSGTSQQLAQILQGVRSFPTP